MASPVQSSFKFRWFTWVLALGICGNLLLFLILTGFVHVPGAYAFSIVSPTPVSLDVMQLTAATPTPFQPLPTNTPTQTPTPTLTPTPTQTNTPLPTNTQVPTDTPFPSPTSDGLPSSYSISNIYGYDQSHRLSCESRSAVDWARFYGISIEEDTFQYSLPISDDPDSGFVGSPDGMEGGLPPNSYGVHAAPVAALLQQYGLNAASEYGMSFYDLRKEIAAGNPVIVWVFGNTWWGGTSVQYTASNGHTSTVIAYEHTVIVTGYDINQDTVTILDGSILYYRSIEQFKSSWETLGNMAVMIQ